MTRRYSHSCCQQIQPDSVQIPYQNIALRITKNLAYSYKCQTARYYHYLQNVAVVPFQLQKTIKNPFTKN